MKHKNSHLLVGYWSRLRKGRAVPEQTDIDPRAKMVSLSMGDRMLVKISAAFLASEPAMGQRLSRARKALRETGTAVRIPDPDQLATPRTLRKMPTRRKQLSSWSR